MTRDAYSEENRIAWDAWTELNYSSAFYDVEGFIAGRNANDHIELEGVGDVAGKRLIHLQCHFGMGTLSWARLGAEVVGVDFSERAIARARELAELTGIPAEFVCCDVNEAADHVSGEFDIVFVSYGAISWLADLRPWAETIARLLKPGGTFFVVDHHPTLWIFDDTDETNRDPAAADLRYRYSYFSREALREEQTGNYSTPESDVATVTYSWNHTFEEIVGSLLAAGLRITDLREYDRMAWAWFPWMEPAEDGLWRMPEGVGDIPLMFSVTATHDA